MTEGIEVGLQRIAEPEAAEIQVADGSALHRWDLARQEWTCLGCGHVSPNPCDCRCKHHRENDE